MIDTEKKFVLISDIEVLMMVKSLECFREDALSINQRDQLACLRELQAYRALINDVVPILADGCDFALACINGTEPLPVQFKNKAEAWQYTVKDLLSRVEILHPMEPTLSLPK